MKFDTVNELVTYANALPRYKGTQRPKTTEFFRIAYVAFCRARDVGVAKYAAQINVAPTTPYSWIPLYDQHITEEVIHAVEIPKLEQGTPLCPKHPGRVGNAVVIEHTADEIVLLTDFGNLVTISLQELEELYFTPDWWKEAQQWGMPLPSVQERVKEQIKLLNTFLCKYPAR